MNATTRHGWLRKLDGDLPERIDVFVCSASFEERCLSIAENVNRQRIAQVVVVRDRRFAAAVEKNLGRLRERFAGKESTVVVDSGDPVLTTVNIVAAMERFRQADVRRVVRVVVDITTFTHEALLILFRVCDVAFDKSCVVDFVYATAGEYSVGDQPAEKWLSKGISEVRSVMGFPGGFRPSRGTHLVVLAGFEDYRVLSLVRELEPSLVTVGYGDRSEKGTEPHQDTNEKNLERIRNLIRNLVSALEQFVFSCYDVNMAEGAIQKVVSEKEGYNTIIAPMNTKISTLGAGMVALRDEAVQICYAQADIYNFERYSRPGNEFYRHRFSDYPAGTNAER